MKIQLAAALLAAVVAAPVFGQAQTPPPSPPVAPGGAPEPLRRHGHPELHHAKRALQNAKRQLERAQPDYGGHRQKALALINQALAEIDAGLKFARKQDEGEQRKGPAQNEPPSGQ